MASIMNKSMADILSEHCESFLATPKAVRDKYHMENALELLKESTIASIDDKHIIMTRPHDPAAEQLIFPKK